MLASGQLVAPTLLLWEITNALRSAVLSKRITAAKADSLLTKFCGLPIEFAGPPNLSELPDLLGLAVSHQLTTYDATYLLLAKSRGLALASYDIQLRQVAKKQKVKLFAA